MSGVPTPPEVTEPFGLNADSGTITLPIPLTTSTPGVASFDKGFPARTMEPIVAGGIPPFGPDANGILYMISAHTAYAQAGQPYKWSSTVAAAIGGYAVGTILGMADGTGVWINQSDANMTNPDGSSPVGWVSLANYGQIDIDVGSVGSTVALSVAQSRRGQIRFTGTLTQNVTVVFPEIFKQWLVSNRAGGAFTVSVTCGTQTASPIVIPQTNGSQPTPLYFDGTNIFVAVPPPTNTGDVSPDANTLVQRDNLGRVFATYFNGSNSIENSLAIVNMIYDSGDGYFRKMGITAFEAQLLLSNMNGQITNGQIAITSVAQFLTAVTATTGQLSIPIAGGLRVIFKWGQITGVSNPSNITIDTNVAFATPFPNAIVLGFCNTTRNVAVNGQAANGSGFTSNRNVNGMTCTIDSSGSGTSNGTWYAIGF